MTGYTTLLLASAAFMVVPAWISLRRLPAPGARPSFYLAILAALWTGAEAAFQIAPTFDRQILCSKLSYVSAFAPLTCLFFALDYRGELNRTRRRLLLGLLAVPVLTLLLVLTNESHHLVWTRYVPFECKGIRLLDTSYGAWFWVFEAYAWIASLGGAALLALTIRRSAKIHREQAALILLAILVAFAANFIYTYRLGPFPGLDLSPLGCAVGAVLFVLSLHRYKLFDLVPVAYDVAIQQLADGVLVLDAQSRLIYANPAAERVLGLTGNRTADAFPPIPGLELERLQPGTRLPWSTPADSVSNPQRHFEIDVSALRRDHKSPPGRILLLHDVTLRRVQDQALQEFQADLLDTNLQLAAMNGELEQSVATSRRLADEAARSRAFAERILTTTPNIVYIYDLDRRNWVYVNQMLTSVLGHSTELALSDGGLRAFIREEDQAALRQFHIRCAELGDGQVEEFEFRVQAADGAWHWLLTREAVFTRDENGAATQLLGSAVDITSRKHAEIVLQEQEERWQLALHGNNDALWDWDIAQGKIYRSPAWKRLLGYRDDEIGSSREEWITRVHPDDFEATERAMQDHLEGRTSRMECEYRMRAKDGSWRWILDRGRCVRDEKGRPIRMAGSKTDITDRKEVERQLAVDAMIDPLTNLPNRRHLMAELERRIEVAASGAGGFLIAIGDVDHFKHVNDTHGHLAGDQVLAALGQKVRAQLRPGDFGGRLGGDEFCFLFPDGHPEEVRALIEDVRVHMQSEVFRAVGDREFRTTMTFGVAQWKPGMDRAAALTAADRALYAAKNAGRNRTVFA